MPTPPEVANYVDTLTAEAKEKYERDKKSRSFQRKQITELIKKIQLDIDNKREPQVRSGLHRLDGVIQEVEKVNARMAELLQDDDAASAAESAAAEEWRGKCEDIQNNAIPLLTEGPRCMSRHSDPSIFPPGTTPPNDGAGATAPPISTGTTGTTPAPAPLSNPFTTAWVPGANPSGRLLPPGAIPKRTGDGLTTTTTTMTTAVSDPPTVNPTSFGPYPPAANSPATSDHRDRDRRSAFHSPARFGRGIYSNRHPFRPTAQRHPYHGGSPGGRGGYTRPPAPPPARHERPRPTPALGTDVMTPNDIHNAARLISTEIDDSKCQTAHDTLSIFRQLEEDIDMNLNARQRQNEENKIRSQFGETKER